MVRFDVDWAPMSTRGLFRKRPVVVEAYRHDGIEALVIHTLEGDVRASPGDWIITGVAGEKYPCKPDIFAKTYEPVDLG